MHSTYPRLSSLFFFLLYLVLVRCEGEQAVVPAGQTITSPPSGQACATQFAHLRRQDLGTTNCSYGICAGTCLDQGAFCCNPGGPTYSPICGL
jgi:hypothetical protein